MQYRLLSALALAGSLIVGSFAAPASAVPASPALAQASGAVERASPQKITEAGWRHRHHNWKFRRHLRRKLHRFFDFGDPYYGKRRYHRERRHFGWHDRPRRYEDYDRRYDRHHW